MKVQCQTHKIYVSSLQLIEIAKRSFLNEFLLDFFKAMFALCVWNQIYGQIVYICKMFGNQSIIIA